MKYNTQADFDAAIAEVVENTNFEGFGKLEPHKDSKPNEPKAYFSHTTSLSGNGGITIAGQKVYPSRIQVGVNAMRLRAEPRVIDETKRAKAATANAATLRDMLYVAPVPAAKV
jgi:hypothetical protein